MANWPFCSRIAWYSGQLQRAFPEAVWPFLRQIWSNLFAGSLETVWFIGFAAQLEDILRNLGPQGCRPVWLKSETAAKEFYVITRLVSKLEQQDLWAPDAQLSRGELQWSLPDAPRSEFKPARKLSSVARIIHSQHLSQQGLFQTQISFKDPRVASHQLGSGRDSPRTSRSLCSKSRIAQ